MPHWHTSDGDRAATRPMQPALVEQNLKHGLAIAQRAIVLNRGAKVFDNDNGELADERRLLAMF